MRRPRVLKNMNSDRSLFLLLWTLFVATYLSFISSWGMGSWDVFNPNAYEELASFIWQWIVLLTPYPLLLVLPPIRRKGG